MATVQCAVTKGDLPMDIFWLFDNNSINSLHGVTTAQMNKRINTISIDSVSAEHAGEYTCVARNKAGAASYSAFLNVNGIDNRIVLVILLFATTTKPIQQTTFSVAPQIYPFDFGSGPMNSGELVTLSCSILKGDLPVTITWSHNNATLEDDVSIVQINKKVSTLTIESVRAEHAGFYTCSAHNAAGPASHSAQLQVNG